MPEDIKVRVRMAKDVSVRVRIIMAEDVEVRVRISRDV